VTESHPAPLIANPAADQLATIRAGVTSLDLPPDQVEAAVTASWIIVACQRKRDDAIKAPAVAGLVAGSTVSTADLDAEADVLQRVARASRTPAVRRLAATVLGPTRLLAAGDA
jgi:uncharacterized protein DUF6545